eukprot:TRINITY_DN1153_c0_g1_i1.p1 TRINITY_DN1153_c0_g1~~TRINITY_DN1153_c0_g1_i1.p1  ORF type:complete len:136 (-),score=27.42 TRINITY_DN1153_c0_g1_i1:62-469(-)
MLQVLRRLGTRKPTKRTTNSFHVFHGESIIHKNTLNIDLTVVSTTASLTPTKQYIEDEYLNTSRTESITLWGHDIDDEVVHEYVGNAGTQPPEYRPIEEENAWSSGRIIGLITKGLQFFSVATLASVCVYSVYRD